ncbi:hypothetical protein FGG75_24895, partial [Escherichia coli]|uniref:hypothetical protein n=1 Tax=Escherichia coli TaxID=562 RepID=UPI00127F3849
VALLASAVGYLATAQALLARLDTSVAIWFLLLADYPAICRGTLIRRRRLACDRVQPRHDELLAQRARAREDAHETDRAQGASE